MAGDNGFWSRVAEEVRTVSDRARGSARRAVQMGVLRVDLVSLRRDRSRALADLGERALTHWVCGAPEAIAADPEALRLRERITSVDRDIETKRAEIDRLREAGRVESRAPDPPTSVVNESIVP